MLNKYDFTNNDDVIDQPSILKITSDQVQIIHAGGTSPDTKEIPEEGLVIQIGNIDSFIPPAQDPIDPDDPEPIPTPTPEDGITMTVMIVNSAGGKLNIRRLQLLLWDEDNQQIQSVTGTITTNNRIEQGSSARCTVIFEKEYEGLHFASEEQYSETSYLCNCGYKINGSDYTFTTSGVSESYIFQDGGSFTVTIPNNTTEWMGGGQTPTYDTDPDPDPQPSGDGNISFTLVNNCGYEVRLCGEANLNIYRNPTDSHGDYAAQLGVHIKGQHSSDWTNNDIILQPGGTKSWTATIDNGYLTGNYYICKNDNPYWAGPIFIYSKYYSVSRSSVQHGNGMYFTDTETQVLQANKNYTFTITKMNEKAILADTSTTVTSLVSSGKSYAILYEGQTSLPQ